MVIYGDVFAWEWQGSSVAYYQSDVIKKWVHHWVIFILEIEFSLRGGLQDINKFSNPSQWRK